MADLEADKGHSIEHIWKNFAATHLVSKGPCELIYAYMAASAAVTECVLYHGQDANGDKIVNLMSALAESREFGNGCAVYCPNGLYLVVGSNVDNVFIMWNELPWKPKV